MKLRALLFLSVGLILIGVAWDQTRKVVPHQNPPTNLHSHQDSPRIDRALTSSASRQSAEEKKQQVLAAYAILPMSFEANQGQTDAQVRFLSRGSGYTLFLTPSEAVLSLQKPRPTEGTVPSARAPARSDKARTATVRIKLIGANPQSRVQGIAPLPGKTSYFIGRDPQKWHSDVPTYSRVEYSYVYPGIDLIYYGDSGLLENDFIVRPGASPEAITLELQAAQGFKIDAQGDLVLHTESGDVRLLKPHAYQQVKGRKQVIPARYVARGKNQVGFEVTAYDRTTPLIIDPILSYSTYLGGSALDDAFGIAVDSSGNAYVTGFTASTNFPTTSGTFQTALAGGFDVFVTKLNATGTALVYATYLGGSSDDEANGIAVDSSGNAYVTGFTASTNFPTTSGAFQTSFGGGPNDAFVTKLNATGTTLVYSTYLGGGGTDDAVGIAVDSSGNAYVTGLTASANFPTSSGAFQTTFGGGPFDVFVTKLNSTGTALAYSTYLGGSGDDEGDGIAVDSNGSAYVTGVTSSINFPTSSGAFQTTFGGGPFDVFVTKLNATGTALAYSTYLGGSGDDEGFGIAVDSTGNAYVTGLTSSTNFPTSLGAFQTTFGGGPFDVFVTKLNATGAALAYSTYLGGSNQDEGFAIRVDSTGNAYVAGLTNSTNFPTTSGAFQTALGGGFDAFVAKVVAAPVVTLSSISPFASQVVGTTSTAKSVTLSNGGDAALSITSIATSGEFAQTNTCGSSVAAGANCTISVTFTPTAGGTRTGTLTITDNAAGSPQSLALSGTGADFSLSASPTSASVTAGQSATYTLTVTPTGGFNQAVALTCSGAPALAKCSISPSSVTLNGTSPSTATVTVTTTAPSMVPPQLQPPPPGSGLQIRLPWLALLAAMATLAALAAKRRRRVSWLVPALALLLFMVLLGCAAGSAGTPKGSSTLTLTGTSGSLSHNTTVTLTVN